MTKLRNERFYHKAKNGEERSLVCGVTVDVDGMFHVTFDDDLEDAVEESLIVGTNMTINRAKKLRVSGNNLANCKTVIGAALVMHMQCEVSEEHVIRYGRKTLATYWKMPDGTIYANGYDAKNDPDYRNEREIVPGEWHGTLDATHHNAGYSVSLYAEVRKKTTYTRPSGEKCEYRSPDFENLSHDSFGERLNCFVGLRNTGHWARGKIDLEEIPYTEEAAKFFYDMLIGMCAFSDKIETFFSEPANVIEAIEAGGVKLIGRDTEG